MMKTEAFGYLSADQKTRINAVRWIPEGEVRAILQISHGMVEHIRRYEEFADYLTGQGILVTGNDHLGHGESVTGQEELAHFPTGGNRILLKDMHALRTITEEAYPGVPYILMGHSMGSFLARQYLCMKGEGLAAAIIMGTGNNPPALLIAAKVMAKLKGLVQGKNHHSKMLTGMAFGAYNKRIDDPVSGNAWLSRDEAQVKKYDDDPLCGLLFSNQAFYEMFSSIHYLHKQAHLDRMPKTLPILLISGEEDPVGAYGKDVQAVADMFHKTGMEDVTVKLYPGARHEVLNEINKEEVYADLGKWIFSKLGLQ